MVLKTVTDAVADICFCVLCFFRAQVKDRFGSRCSGLLRLCYCRCFICGGFFLEFLFMIIGPNFRDCLTVVILMVAICGNCCEDDLVFRFCHFNNWHLGFFPVKDQFCWFYQFYFLSNRLFIESY